MSNSPQTTVEAEGTSHLSHRPVMPAEVLAALEAERGGSFLDGTFGGGGHTALILQANPQSQVLAMDCDPRAVARADAMAAEFGSRFRFVRQNFAEMPKLGDERFDGMFFDLGVSSFQLDEAARGFSFRREAPADMRMDDSGGWTAADFLESAPEQELIRAVRDFGEEPCWRRVVQAILQQRGSGRLATTAGLASLIEEVVGRNPRAGAKRIHPATRTFQGIRMAVNRELENLQTMLPEAFQRLAPGGRLVVISFHSLEDRIVKRYFREKAGRPVDRFDSRVADEREVAARLPFNRPLVPAAEEIRDNPRSRSARLRAIIKLN